METLTVNRFLDQVRVDFETRWGTCRVHLRPGAEPTYSGRGSWEIPDDDLARLLRLARAEAS